MKIIKRNFFKLSKKEVEFLKKLTLHSERSGMNEALNCRETEEFKNRYNICQAFIAFDDESDKWIGWCLAFENKLLEQNSYMIFIDPDFRKKGIGKLLMNKAITFLKNKNLFKHYCYPWSFDSTAFFNKIKIHHPLKDKVY